MNDMDKHLLSTLRQFQPCDLYSKSNDFSAIKDVQAYYEQLLREFDLDKPLRFRKMTLPVAVPAVAPGQSEHTASA